MVYDRGAAAEVVEVTPTWRLEGLVVVAGGGGFIGGWLTRSLVHEGVSVRAVDYRPVDEWQRLH